MNDSSITSPPGQVLTPLPWARRLVDGTLFEQWQRGATVFDPTGGAGHILEAFISLAVERGIEVTGPMLSRLSMMELDDRLIEQWFRRIRDRYGLSAPPRTAIEGDFLLDDLPPPVDLLAGNPPWVSFVDLPSGYRERLKPCFRRYGITADSRAMLWGNSRVDLAALVLTRAFSEMLVEDHGSSRRCAAFFLPAGIFRDDGAHTPFLRRIADSRFPQLSERVDLTNHRVFDTVHTQYVGAWFSHSGRDKTESTAGSVSDSTAASTAETTADPAAGTGRLRICACSRPRQGVNTCGANALFMFPRNKEPDVETELLFPLIDSGQFASSRDAADEASAGRTILLPYDQESGKPLSSERLSVDFPRTWAYLCTQSDRLRARRGTVIGNMIKRGFWWAMLGVGPYTFAPFKIVWPAYGARSFTPRLFIGRWIPNQALQCSMGFFDRAEARRVHAFLSQPQIETALHAAGGAGTPGWAQPGRMARFFDW